MKQQQNRFRDCPVIGRCFLGHGENYMNPQDCVIKCVCMWVGGTGIDNLCPHRHSPRSVCFLALPVVPKGLKLLLPYCSGSWKALPSCSLLLSRPPGNHFHFLLWAFGIQQLHDSPGFPPISPPFHSAFSFSLKINLFEGKMQQKRISFLLKTSCFPSLHCLKELLLLCFQKVVVCFFFGEPQSISALASLKLFFGIYTIAFKKSIIMSVHSFIHSANI